MGFFFGVTTEQLQVCAVGWLFELLFVVALLVNVRRLARKR